MSSRTGSQKVINIVMTINGKEYSTLRKAADILEMPEGTLSWMFSAGRLNEGDEVNGKTIEKILPVYSIEELLEQDKFWWERA